jgi:hypothetical protein
VVNRFAAIAIGLVLVVLAVGCVAEPEAVLLGDQVHLKWPVPPFPWSAVASGFSSQLEATPGDLWTLDVSVEADLTNYEQKYGEFSQIVVVVQAVRQHDEQGFYRNGLSTFAISSNFTTTGVPIEHFDGWPRFRLIQGKDGSPFEAIVRFDLPNEIAGVHRFAGQLTVAIPDDIPEGYYEPRVYVLVQVRDVPHPIHLALYGNEWNDWWPPALPLVKVGSPAAPKIPWTIFSDFKYRGRSGTLPIEWAGRVELCGRAGFPAETVLPPGNYEISPGLPSLFPRTNMATVDGGLEVVPGSLVHYLRPHTMTMNCSVEGPRGAVDLGEKQVGWFDEQGVQTDSGPYLADMTSPGKYRVRLNGTVSDAFGREFKGGGTYEILIARPLTFSTSCKPGTSFLVGNGYPAKVNVNPPFAAEVEVTVEYYPNSDPGRKVTWVGSGHANRFGHFVPHDTPPIIFDEPGEYKSHIRARHTDESGMLWAGEQVSVGVIAPVEPGVLRMHGTRNFPLNNRFDLPYYGAVKRYTARENIHTSFLPETPYMLMDPFLPYNSTDTLYLPTSFSEENIIEPHVSMGITDEQLRGELIDAMSRKSMIVPEFYQPWRGPWRYLKDVVQVSIDSYGLFSVHENDFDEIPIIPVGREGWSPVAFPSKARFEAYTTMGIVRPGFPVMTSAFQGEAIGLYWVASPNRYGNHINAGRNGDLPNDVYRAQLGAVLKDLDTGKNYYDAYGVSISVIAADGKDNAISVLGPGERPFLVVNGREQQVLLATDTNDAVVVGEMLHLGGMVFPNVEADVTWTVTKPSGETVISKGKANRLGLARGLPSILADEPGIYTIRVGVEYEGLVGDVVGTANGEFWHAAAPEIDPEVLSTNVPGMINVDPAKGTRIRLSWPENTEDVKVHFGVMMPGQVLDQGVVSPEGNFWEYPVDPMQIAEQFPNFDVRDYSSGDPMMADTAVFQFVLIGSDDGENVVDTARLVLRGNRLFDLENMTNSTGQMPAGHPKKFEP